MGVRTGKLSISRGYRTGDRPAPAPRLVLVPREAGPRPASPQGKPSAPPAAAMTPEYQPTHDRLAALERLARLLKQGALTLDEFALEKSRLLGAPSSELLLEHPAPAVVPSQRGPSLAGRLFDWRLLPLGLALGIGLSYASQPQETTRFFDDLLRLVGV